MAQRKLVVIGMLGTTLDAGMGEARKRRWRPTVSIFQHEDLRVDRCELLHPRRSQALADVVKNDIIEHSTATQVNCIPFDLSDPWDFEEVYGALHDFARSYPFHHEAEDYLVHITTGTHVAQICMFLLTETNDNPSGNYSIIDLDLSRYDRIASRFESVQREGLSFLKAGIDTRNPAFNALIERIEQVAVASTAPLLLLGPTGAGKTQLAKRIYELKKQRRQVVGDFVEVNCATLRGDAAMSTLFGHVKGAFTGAVGDRPGLLRKANAGLLFLDEIGELGQDEQAMLLRAIEHKVFYPVGSDKEVRSDFQLIAGTNRDLLNLASKGKFRADLVARIHLWTFRLPGLRERPDDIEPNLSYELDGASKSLGRSVTMSREAREAFLRFATGPSAIWSGNFRDLNAAVVRMSTLAGGGRITPALVREELERLQQSWGEDASCTQEHKGDSSLVEKVLGKNAVEKLDRFDRVQLEDVLRVCMSSSSLSEAGRVLFAQSRTKKTSTNDADRLRKYLAKFGLSADICHSQPLAQ